MSYKIALGDTCFNSYKKAYYLLYSASQSEEIKDFLLQLKYDIHFTFYYAVLLI